MRKKMKIAAILLAVTVFVVMLFSALFIAAEADHECIGNGCPICCQISACRDTLKNLSLAVFAAAVTAAFSYTLYRTVSVFADTLSSRTLISLKVKLTD